MARSTGRCELVLFRPAPQATNTAQLPINGVEVDRLGHGLCHDNAIERIPMMHRQIGDDRRGLPAQEQFGESRAPPLRWLSSQVRTAKSVLPSARLDGNLPDADRAEHDFIGWILDYIAHCPG